MNDLKKEFSIIIKKAEDILKAKQVEYEIDLSFSKGVNFEVNKQELETSEFEENQYLSITIYNKLRKGSVSIKRLDEKSIEKAIDKSLSISEYNSKDSLNVLMQDLSGRKMQNLDLFHPTSIHNYDLIEDILECEKIALNNFENIESDGAGISYFKNFNIYLNSYGFLGERESTFYSKNISVIAKNRDKMYKGYSYSRNCILHNLKDNSYIAFDACQRAIKKLNTGSLKTGKNSVILDSRISSCLFSAFLSSINGYKIYKNSSVLNNKLNELVFSENINIFEKPQIVQNLNSKNFDSDGFVTFDKTIVKNGVLQTYILDNYSAQKLGMTSTAHASGVSNIIVEGIEKLDGLDSLFLKMNNGVFITDLIGQNINIVNGDFSSGANGFLVENGTVKYAVNDITIAGNLLNMWKDIESCSDDLVQENNIQIGSILLRNLTVAG